MRFDLTDGFPCLTTKDLHLRSIIRELLWFLKGDTNIAYLKEKNVSIWDEWADENGDLGPVYGSQWRNWPTPGERQEGIDQLSEVVARIRSDPDSRRLIVSAWNVAEVPRMKLPPCHALYQFRVSGDRLDLQMYQRSADMALGVPFNIASYALLLTLAARETGLEPGVFVHTLGDAHVYLNHLDGLEEQLARDPFPLPRLETPHKPLDDVVFEDIALKGYQHHPFIKFEVAV